MFFLYKCRKCKKEWRYPVSRCIFCGGEVDSISVTGLRVKRKVEVFVPSPDSELIPYSCVQLSDGRGHSFFKKTIKKYKVGDSYKNGNGGVKSGSRVSLVKTKYDVVGATVESLKLVEKEIKKDSSVLIKPNLALAKDGESGIVTNPLVVKGILKYLIEIGKVSVKKILVAEYGVVGFDTKKALEKSGLKDVCRRYGVVFKDLSTMEYVNKSITYEGKKYNFRIAKEVYDRDLIINVPVIKTHFQTGWSLALKNMKGVVDGPTRKIMHQEGLHLPIALLNKLLPKYLTVMDGSVALEGMGPAMLGKSVKLGLVLSSMDAVAIERVVGKIIGISPVKHTKLAASLGLGNFNLQDIKIVGEELELARRSFEKADKKLSPHPDISLVDGKPCSGCLNSLWLVLNNLRVKRGKKSLVAFGKDIDVNKLSKKKMGAVGICAIRQLSGSGLMTSSLGGCPPSVEEITEYIKRLLDEDK